MSGRSSRSLGHAQLAHLGLPATPVAGDALGAVGGLHGLLRALAGAGRNLAPGDALRLGVVAVRDRRVLAGGGSGDGRARRAALPRGRGLGCCLLGRHHELRSVVVARRHDKGARNDRLRYELAHGLRTARGLRRPGVGRSAGLRCRHERLAPRRPSASPSSSPPTSTWERPYAANGAPARSRAAPGGATLARRAAATRRATGSPGRIGAAHPSRCRAARGAASAAACVGRRTTRSRTDAAGLVAVLLRRRRDTAIATAGQKSEQKRRETQRYRRGGFHVFEDAWSTRSHVSPHTLFDVHCRG